MLKISQFVPQIPTLYWPNTHFICGYRNRISLNLGKFITKGNLKLVGFWNNQMNVDHLKKMQIYVFKTKILKWKWWICHFSNEPAHSGFLKHWNSKKSVCNIWQRFPWPYFSVWLWRHFVNFWVKIEVSKLLST